ncbi:glycosyltransferase [Pasteurellaceae bacterium LIM206]|nr:glycosyltransferase [Pasteurellaceae bacterium LIM206]
METKHQYRLIEANKALKSSIKRMNKTNIYLISDDLTRSALSLEPAVELVSARFEFLQHRALKQADILLVESAWQGENNRWKYKIASYPNVPRRNNNALCRLVEQAKDLGVPTAFWNKEDDVHFDRFIDSAKLFDYVFTVDENCIKKYRSLLPETTIVDVAMFPIQPNIHHFKGFSFKRYEANFIGSYSSHIHDRRRMWQETLFSAAKNVGMPVTVFDRNSDRKSSNYRYPAEQFNLNVQPSIDYLHTADVYRQYLVSLNVNTIEDSPSMFSRRVVEILACGGILVSTPSLAMEILFKDYCHIVHNQEEAEDVLARLKFGPSKQDLEMAKAGADFVLNNFTWKQFLEKIYQTIYQKK